MTQDNLFPNTIDIPGLSYHPKYITTDQEIDFVNIIDTQPWLTELNRRVQHYGFKYDYKKRSLDSSSYIGPLPNWLKNIIIKLLNDRIFDTAPNQVIVNEYLPGQGISSHIDSTTAFGNTICSLSIGSKCIMNFIKEEKKSFLLEPRSLIVLKNDARYLWHHGIAARKNDKYEEILLPRTRRLSLTFRTVSCS